MMIINVTPYIAHESDNWGSDGSDDEQSKVGTCNLQVPKGM